MSLIDLASEEAERLGVKVVAIHLKLGPLCGVVKEALQSAYGLSAARRRPRCAAGVNWK